MDFDVKELAQHHKRNKRHSEEIERVLTAELIPETDPTESLDQCMAQQDQLVEHSLRDMHEVLAQRQSMPASESPQAVKLINEFQELENNIKAYKDATKFTTRDVRPTKKFTGNTADDFLKSFMN